MGFAWHAEYTTVADRLTRTFAARVHLATNMPESEVPIIVSGPVRRIIQSQADGWLEVQEDLKALVTRIPVIANEPDRTTEAKRRDLRDRISATRSSVTEKLRASREASAQLLADLERKLLPARPNAGDMAAQEAAIAGRKSDYRMVADSAPGGDETVHALSQLLEEALAAEDQVGAWVLATSGWTDLYLRSRGFEDYAPMWRLDAVPRMLRNGDDAMRSLSRIIEHLRGPNGLNTALDLMTELTRSVIDDLDPDQLVTAKPW